MKGPSAGNRVPPHNLQAEESLLGAMLLAKTAIDTAKRLVVPADFYMPAHGHICHALFTLFDNGEPCDTVTVADYLGKTGMLESVGGPATLVTLQTYTPATSNAGRYATIVAEASQLRAIQRAAADAVEMAYDSPEPGFVIDFLTAAIGRVDLSLGSLPDSLFVLDEFLDAAQERGKPPWVIPGLLRVGWRVVLVAAEGVGKALALDTPIPTPDGWTTMGDLVVGDRVFGSDGQPCNVIAATDVMTDRPCYEVEFSDGTVIVADADHQWVTTTVADREYRRAAQVRTTSELADTVRVRGNGVANHSVDPCDPIDGDPTELPIDPYLLGAWLGDGTTRSAGFTSADPEILQAFTDAGYEVTKAHGKYAYRINGATRWNRAESFQSALRRLGLLRNKHIPTAYLRAPMKDRLALLQGLMDTDGTIDHRGSAEFCVCNERLAADTHELVLSLGHKTPLKVGPAALGGTRWRITFRPRHDVFRLPRKLERQTEPTRRANLRYITDVRPIDSVPVRCIQVDSPDQTYLASDAFIPTHNSVLFRQIAIAAAQGIHPLSFDVIKERPPITLIIDLENPEDAIVDVCQPIRDEALGRAKDSYDAERAWLWWQPQGMNLRSRAGKAKLEAVIEHVRPEVVAIGPLYKLYAVDSNERDEQAALEVMRILDDLRIRYRFGLLIEHHAPKGSGSSRDMTPYGSSLWLRWSEIGLTMTPVGDDPEDLTLMRLGRFRGDRVEHAWPNRVRRSKPWPFAGEWDAGTVRQPPDTVEDF